MLFNIFTFFFSRIIILAREEIYAIDQQIDKLLENITNYRESYRVLEETHLELGKYETNIADPVEEMTKEIAHLKERYEKGKKGYQNKWLTENIKQKRIFKVAYKMIVSRKK